MSLSEQELREQIAQEIEGMADHLAKHGTGRYGVSERAGLHMAARIARNLDHFRMVCPDCTSQVGGITPALAEQYADEHRAKGHTPRIEDERDDAA